jgi:hypothetical protein
VGERSLPRLSGRCHGLRKPGRKLRSRRLLGASVSSKKGPCHTTGFASVTEGATNQVDWRAVVVADPVWEAEPLPVWETELLPGDTGVGENTSLAKREC